MVYTVTVPRGPIAAMHSGPGPCYALPGLMGEPAHDPRSVHHKYPAWSFGVRHGKLTDDCSPGPVYNPDCKVYRDGRDGTPHYSLYSRQRQRLPMAVPGPGAYRPEGAGPSSRHSAPVFSFGIRHRHRTTDDVPAPNTYNSLSMLGSTVQSSKRQAPCYSLTGRSKTGGFDQDLKKTPGPGAYDTPYLNHYRGKQPQYSMTGRNVMPGDSMMKPGPGAHSPEKTWVHKSERPHFSFGIRHSQYLTPLIVDPE